jgi:hypothetical protein
MYVPTYIISSERSCMGRPGHRLLPLTEIASPTARPRAITAGRIRQLARKAMVDSRGLCRVATRKRNTERFAPSSGRTALPHRNGR